MKSFILVLLFQFVTLIVVSQPVSRLDDVDATDITNYEAHRYPRTLKSKHPPCRINQYFDVDKGDCMGVIGGGKALYVNNKKSCGSNVLKPHCTNPRYYYICRQNKTILAQCPQNRHFESHLQKCILVPREKHISATNGQNSDTFDSVQHLECLKTGSFPVPDNCGLFYTCSMHGNKMNKNFYTCPKNMAYNTETEMCKPSNTCREPESLTSCRNHPWDGKKENMALKEAVFPIKGRSETCETIFTNEEDTTTNSTSENNDEIMSITASYTKPFVSELTRSGDSNDIVTTTERALEKSRFTNTGDFAIPITATYSTMAVENTYPTEFNLPIEVNGNKELGSRTVAGPFENGHTRIITDDPEEQSPDDQDRTAPTILDDPSMLENTEGENIPGSKNPRFGKQYSTTEEFNKEPMSGIRNIDTEPITFANPTSIRSNKPITNLDSNKPPLEIPIDDPTLQNQHSTTKKFNEESFNGAENTLPIITEDVTAPSRSEEQPIAEIIPTESPVQIPIEEPNLENQHSIQEESSEKPITKNESMNIAPTISEDPTILNNVEAKEEPATAIIPIEPSVQIPISEDPNLADEYKAPENLNEESTTETENINAEEIIVGDPTTLINTEPEEEPVTKVISDESPVGIPSNENSALPIAETENINTEPTILTDSTTLINTESEEDPAKEVVLNESPVVIPTTENSQLPITEIENINTEPTLISDPATLINTEQEEEPATKVISDESPVGIPSNENSALPITETENINTEPTLLADPATLMNTEQEEEPATKVISDESPVGIPSNENSALPITETENINTEPTLLADPATLMNTEQEEEPATKVISDESPVGIPSNENSALPITETENINTEPTLLSDPATLMNTEQEEEPATKVISDESPVGIPSNENSALPITETENINTEPTLLADPATLMNTEQEEEPATKVISDESPVGIPSNENSALPITETENINTEPTLLSDPATLMNTEPEEDPAKEVVLNESPVVIPSNENSALPITETENINTEPTLLSDPATLMNTEPQEEPATKVISDESPVGIPSNENSALPITETENINTEPTLLSDPATLMNTEQEEEPATKVISDESPVGIPSNENSALPITETENINTEPTLLSDPATLMNTEPEEDPAKEVVLNESPVVIPSNENSALPITEAENINTEPTLLSDPATLMNTEPQEEPATKVISDESSVGIPSNENSALPITETENNNTEPTLLSDPATLMNTEPQEEPATKVISDESSVGIPSNENSALPITEAENINTEPTILTDSTTLINTEPQEEPATKVISEGSPVEIRSNENSALPITETENINTEPTILTDSTTLINTEPEEEPAKELVLNESPVVIPTTENSQLPITEIENINTEPTLLSDPATLINTEPQEEPATKVISDESSVGIPSNENSALPITETEDINTEPTILTDSTTLINTEPEEEPAKEVVLNESPVVIPNTENSQLPSTEIENINTEPTLLSDPATLINMEPQEEPATKVISDESSVGIPSNENSALPITETENINTEPTLLSDPATLINTEPQEEPATKVISDESSVGIPSNENSALPITETEDINTEPTILTDSTTLINTEPEEEPATKVISDESPVGIPSNENSQLPITEIENINTEPTLLSDPTTLINTEPEEEPATKVISDESSVGIPSNKNSALPIIETENINTEPTLLSDPTARINTESEEEPAKEVVLNESPVAIPSTENPELPMSEIENINTEPTGLPDSTTLIDTEPNKVTKVILDKSPVGTSVTENPSLEKEYSNILTNSIAPETTKPQEQPITYIIPTESFSETEGAKEPILEVERTVTEEFTKVPTIGTETIDTTSAILPDALISNMTVPRETNTGTEENEPLLERNRSEEFILHDPYTTPVLNGIITASKADPEHNNKGSDEQIPIKYGSGESSNYDLNRMITTDPTSLISTNGESVLQNDSARPEINTEETFLNVITEKPDSRAMERHSKSSHKHSQIIDKEDACNNIAQKESATTPKDIHMPSAISYIIDKIKQCLTKILNMLHH